jgi:hypothetical protein
MLMTSPNRSFERKSIPLISGKRVSTAPKPTAMASRMVVLPAALSPTRRVCVDQVVILIY